MEQGRIVTPLSSDWFRTMSFGDVVKIVAFLGTGLVMFTNVKNDLAHESEMRMLLEQHTMEVVTELRSAQKENMIRADQRFAENMSRDRDLMTELKSRMDRMEAKIDNLTTRNGGH